MSGRRMPMDIAAESLGRAATAMEATFGLLHSKLSAVEAAVLPAATRADALAERCVSAVERGAEALQCIADRLPPR